MANFYITHHLYPDNPQFFTINISQIVKSEGEPDTDFFRDNRGEHYWEMSIHTSATDGNGDSVDVQWVDVFDTELDVDEAVSEKLRHVCSLIDWSSQGEIVALPDVCSPFISSQTPASGATAVPIESSIRVVIKENLPSKGIDISSLVFKVKDIEVLPTVTGNPYEYTLVYSPLPLV